jgi:hypothetical protein
MGGTATGKPKYGAGRTARREKVFLGGKIVTDHATFDCTIRDRSGDGARIRVLFQEHLPAEFHLIDVKAGVAQEAELIWSDGPLHGVRFRRTWDLKTPSDPAHARLRRLWLECAPRTSEL